jgi:hypothetical protein
MAARSTAVDTNSNGRSGVFAQWVSAMQLEAEMPGNDSFDPSQILGAIMDADDFDKAVELQDSSLRSGKDLVNWQHRIVDFALIKSDAKYAANERSLGVYARVTGIGLEDGEEITYGVGASNVLAILWQARKFGRIPGDFVIQSRPTQEGELLSLKPVGKRTVKVS